MNFDIINIVKTAWSIFIHPALAIPRMVYLLLYKDEPNYAPPQVGPEVDDFKEFDAWGIKTAYTAPEAPLSQELKDIIDNTPPAPEPVEPPNPYDFYTSPALTNEDLANSVVDPEAWDPGNYPSEISDYSYGGVNNPDDKGHTYDEEPSTPSPTTAEAGSTVGANMDAAASTQSGLGTASTATNPDSPTNGVTTDPNANNGGDGDEDNDDSPSSGKPVVIDLDGDGVEIVVLEDSTAFYDLDGDGYSELMAWAGADDGLLAYDKNGDGVISGAGEISFTGYVDGAKTDLEGLRFFDTNGNGLLDAGDAEWESFGVWQDANQDGVQDEGEFISLDDAGIESIELESDGVVEQVGGSTIFGTSSYTRTDGSTGAVGDVALAVSGVGIKEEADGSTTIRGGAGDLYRVLSDTAPTNIDLTAEGLSGVFGTDRDETFTASGSDGVLIAAAGGNDVIVSSPANDNDVLFPAGAQAA